MLVFIGNYAAALFKSCDELVDFLPLCGHLVELLLEDIEEEEDDLDLILYFLHILGRYFEVDLLQK